MCVFLKYVPGVCVCVCVFEVCAWVFAHLSYICVSFNRNKEVYSYCVQCVCILFLVLLFT
jgi:hypothetical protein